MGNLEKTNLFQPFNDNVTHTIVQPFQGSAIVQDAQFTSWWHGYPKPDSNEIYTQLTGIKHENC